MIELSAERIVAACDARVVHEGTRRRVESVVVDSREVGPGDLFAGLPGARVDGGQFAADALGAGAWGVLVSSQRAEQIELDEDVDGWVIAAADPLLALGGLAREWRRELGCRVVGITGSTGKTSVKDICRTLLPFRVHASRENYNTEIGLPLAVLAAPRETEVLVLEMAMRGMGQIAELCAIAEPDVAAITNIGPVHLELLGTIEAIAEAKAEIFAGLTDAGVAVLPEDAEALEPHVHDLLRTVSFGPGGDVFAHSAKVDDGWTLASIGTPHGDADFRFPFSEAHNLANALAAIAIGVALDAPPAQMAERAPEIVFSRLRGEVLEAGGVRIVNDCYNANPISMRAALDHLATVEAPGRRIAVLGEMRELGPDSPAYHREVGAHARDLGIGPLLGVGELARDYAPDDWAADARAAIGVVGPLVHSGDVVLVKGSRSVGLELVSDELVARLDNAERER